MDWDAFAAMGGKIRWVGDNLIIPQAKPRHLGRPVTFFYYDTDQPSNYDGINVIGTLNAIVGETLIVTGDEYSYNRISDLKVWRREVQA